MEYLPVCFLQNVILVVSLVESVLGERKHDICCNTSPLVNTFCTNLIGNDKTNLDGIGMEENERYQRESCFTDSSMYADSPFEQVSTNRGEYYKSQTSVITKTQITTKRNKKKLKGSKRQRKKKKKKIFKNKHKR
uniref:Uncharacterized protein n=1 Tax=Arion vulgaris TaxID=1028688 RepID=A0A0B6ZCC2_9EUPU